MGATKGGFDDVVSEQSAEASYWMTATVNHVAVSGRMKYLMRYDSHYKTTDAYHIRHLKGSMRNKFRHCKPAPQMYLNITTATGKTKFIKIPFDEMMNFITFDSISADPTKAVDEINVKMTENTCEIERVGEFSITDEPEAWMGLAYFTENGAKYNEVSRCLNYAISKLRKKWAKDNDYYSRVWTVKSVDDPENTETATIHLQSGTEETTFTLSPPEDVTADKPLPNFIRNTGEGLLSNVETAEVYVSFEKISGEVIARNEIGLNLHALDAKPPEGLIEKLTSYL